MYCSWIRVVYSNISVLFRCLQFSPLVFICNLPIRYVLRSNTLKLDNPHFFFSWIKLKLVKQQGCWKQRFGAIGSGMVCLSRLQSCIIFQVYCCKSILSQIDINWNVKFVTSDAESRCQMTFDDSENVESVCMASREDKSIHHDLFKLKGDFSEQSALSKVKSSIESETGLTVEAVPHQTNLRFSVVLKIENSESFEGKFGYIDLILCLSKHRWTQRKTNMGVFKISFQ